MINEDICGEGTFIYECNKPECAFCLAIGLNRKLSPMEIHAFIRPKRGRPVIEDRGHVLNLSYKNDYSSLTSPTRFNVIPTNTSLIRAIKRKIK